MSWLTRTFTSSIGKKFLVGLTGLGIFSFLIIHLVGNLNLFLGAESFNKYAKFLHDQALLPLAEIGLVGAFVIHVILVLQLAYSNKQARGPVGYTAPLQSKQPAEAQRRAAASKATLVGGLVILTFVLVHIWDFRLARMSSGGLTTFDKVQAALSIPWRACLYAVGSVFVGWHLYHGIQSGFRTLGVHHPRYSFYFQTFGAIAAVVLGLGFFSLPVAIFLGFIK